MVLGLALISPWLLLVALVPVVLLWYIIKAYGAVDQRLRDLDAVHGFTGRVGQSLDPDEIVRAASRALPIVLRTDGAAVVVFGDPTVVGVHRSRRSRRALADRFRRPRPERSWSRRTER
jgi:hypothetical protein